MKRITSLFKFIIIAFISSCIGNETGNTGAIELSILWNIETNLIDVYTHIPPCENGGSPIGFPIMLDINVLPSGEECSTNPNGEFAYRPKEIQIADKNDGVVNIHSVLWSKGDALISDHNQYFDDVSVDGGYNHFELRNHKRAYALPGYFNKGDKNPSMEKVEFWIRDGFEF